MNEIYEPLESDERSRQLALQGWILHVAGLIPVLACVAVYFFAYREPLSAEEQRLSQRVTEVAQLLEDARGIRGELAALGSQLESQQRRAAEVRRRIPDDPDEAEFLRQLSEAASRGGVVIEDFNRGGMTARAGFCQLDVSLRCGGSYDDICRFLDQLEGFPRITKIVSLDLISAGRSERYPMQLTIRLYFGVRQASEIASAAHDGRTGPSRAAAGRRDLHAPVSRRLANRIRSHERPVPGADVSDRPGERRRHG